MRPGTSVKALCADGIVRSARILRDADTYFTIPARVTVKGRTITGFVWSETGDDMLPRFTPDAWRSNADALPRWPEGGAQ